MVGFTTPDGLTAYLYGNAGLQRFLSNLFSSQTVLFLGVPRRTVEAIFRSLPGFASGSRTHYAVMPWEADLELHTRGLADRFGVLALPYSPRLDVPMLGAFLERLRKQASGSTLDDASRAATAVLTSVRLENIGPFEHLELSFTEGSNIILGNNGCGKSTLLRALAIGLAGDDPSVQRTAPGLVRNPTMPGAIVLTFSDIEYKTEIAREGEKTVAKIAGISPLQAGRAALGFPALRGAPGANPKGATREIVRGPDVEDLLPLIHSRPDSRSESMKQWLVNHSLRASDGDKRSSSMISAFFRVLGDLTPGVSCTFQKIDKETWDVLVETKDGVVPIDRVSQGTASIFAWVGTLIQRLYDFYPKESAPLAMPALALVDEIDAHMHPAWQRLLLDGIKKHFPALQLIATTHSPFIAAAADPGRVQCMVRDASGRVETRRYSIDLGQLRVDQVLTSPVFGLDTTRNVQTAELKEKYRTLLGLEKPTKAQLLELESIEAKLGRSIASHHETETTRKVAKLFKQWVVTHLAAEPEAARKALSEEATAYVAELGRDAPEASTKGGAT